MVYWSLLIASLIGAVGLWLILARSERPLRLLGLILGLGALAFALAQTARLGVGLGTAGDRPPILFYLFAVISVGCAGRMITHSRPVYSALYFVLVVLSTAAIFLYLEAEFMAFALVIVYAGAILITYLFVLMLAQQAPTADVGEATPEYDRLPREPAVAVFAGFLLLALLGQVIFGGLRQLPPSPGEGLRHGAVIAEVNQQENRRAAIVSLFIEKGVDLTPDATIVNVADASAAFTVPPLGRLVEVRYEDIGLKPAEALGLLPTNIERVGWALVSTYPVSLELAGVILLMAMFGAVVLSRKQIELSEDEKRAAAGMGRLSVEVETGGGGGAT